MPWLGLGVWMARDGDEVKQAVKTALQLGYRHIDTAAAYGNEVGVGEAIRESGVPRAEIFVTTKVWNRDQGYESTLAAFDASLSRLGLEYVDLYLIHWAVPGKYMDTWRALETLYRDGKVRAIGVANFQPEHLEEVMSQGSVKPMVNQVELHPYHTQDRLWNFCREHNVQLEAWSPLFRGGELLKEPVLAEIGRKHGKSSAQVVLRWDLQREVVTIPKSVHGERIRENADLFDFALTEEEMAWISGLNQSRQAFDYDPYDVNF